MPRSSDHSLYDERNEDRKMNHYSAHVEVDVRKQPSDTTVDELVDQLAPYHGALGMSQHGLLSVQMTVTGDTMPQAAVTAIAVVESILGGAVVAIELMTEHEFNRREGWDTEGDDLLTTTQAAELLGISRQAVGQRLNAGTLHGERRGRDWLVHGQSLEAELRRRRGVAAALEERAGG